MTEPNLFDGLDGFDNQEPSPSTPIDVSDIAAHIAENTPHRDYTDRTSEAANDQGWGPVTLPETAEESGASNPTAQSRLELPGKNGRRNPGTQSMTPIEAQRGMSNEAIDEQARINKAAAAAIRAAHNLPSKP